MTEERIYTLHHNDIKTIRKKNKNIRYRIKRVSYRLRLVNEAREKTIASEQRNYGL